MGFVVTFRYDAPDDRPFTAPVTVSTAFWPLFAIDAKLLKKLRLDGSVVKAYRTRGEGGADNLDAWAQAVKNGTAAVSQPGEFDISDDDISIPCTAQDIDQWAGNWLNLFEQAGDAMLTELFLPSYGELKPGWLNASKMVIDPVSLKSGIDSIKDGLQQLAVQAAEAARCGLGMVCRVREGG